MAIIYALTDPDNCIRYVGYTSQTMNKRFSAHMRDARIGCINHRSAWIRSLTSGGLVPVMVKLEDVSEDNWRERERFWIASIRAQGNDLCNHTDGGDSGHRLDQRTRDLISLIRTGTKMPPMSEARKLQMSIARKGIKKCPIAVALRAAKKKGTKSAPASEERKRKISEKRKAYWASIPESERKQSSEHVAKRVAKRLGKKRPPMTDAQKEKLRIGQLAYQAAKRAVNLAASEI